MNDSPWKDEATRRCSRWLDADEEGQLLAERESSIDQQTQMHMADLQLIDALLSNMSDHTVDQREHRIRSVMEAIDEVTPARPHRGSIRRWYSIAALAAGLLITCIGFWLQFSGESVAEELLVKIRQVSLENTDRVYNLKRITSASGARHERDGKLYLRGVEGFVVQYGNVILGRDGNEFWFVAPRGKVVVADDFEWLIASSTDRGHEIALLKELSIESRNVPLMELTSVVKLLQHDYDVSLRRGMRFGQHRVDELDGTRRSISSDLPDRIRLWSGKDSQIIYRAEFIWEQEEEESQQNSLVLELANPEAVPAEWYRLDTHRADDQPVRRLSSGS